MAPTMKQPLVLPNWILNGKPACDVTTTPPTQSVEPTNVWEAGLSELGSAAGLLLGLTAT